MVNRRLVVAIILCAALFVGVGIVRAQSGDPQGVPLSLGQCQRTALQNNLDLISARKNPQISEQQVGSQEATYDPVLVAGLSTDETEQRPVDPTLPSSRTNLNASVGVQQALPFGADYSATLATQENDAPGFNSTINPFKSSSLDLRFNMPLLRGFGQESEQEQLLLARGDLEISREELRRQAELTMETVEGAYWNVLAAGEAIRVARQSLERAEDLLDLNRKKVEVGTLAPIEITQAKAGVAAQEEGVIIAETDLANAEDELRRLMAVPQGDPIWERPLVLTDRPVFDPKEIDLEAAIAQALDSRPEMASVKQTLRNRELSARVASKNLRHGLDLNLIFVPSGDNDESFIDPGPDGMPGTLDDMFVIVEESLGDSFAEIAKAENYFWRAGLTYTIPIGNKAAKAGHRIAELNYEKAEIDVQNQAQTIRVEVRRAVRAVESDAKRVVAARVNVELQKEKLDAEQKKFQNGMSTSFEVLTFQNDLADAELRRIRALLDYFRSVAALERSKGTLLEARGLSLAS